LAALFIQVVNRYFLAVSWPFIQMLIPLCFVWLSMLGTAVAVRKKLHFDIDLISGRL
jgi:TRAP-type C4-dicarboxylate transport system permease small subunit